MDNGPDSNKINPPSVHWTNLTLAERIIPNRHTDNLYLVPVPVLVKEYSIPCTFDRLR